MAEPNVTAIALKLGITALHKAAPKGIAWVKDWYIGRNVWVLGPAGAGKTCFVDYLRFGFLEPQGPTTPTYDIVRVKKVSSVALQTNNNRALDLTVRSISDVSGHLPPAKQAELVKTHAPHVLVIVSDIHDRRCRQWLLEFIEGLSGELSRGLRASWALECLCIVMNKFDRVSKPHADMRGRQFRKLLDKYLKPVLKPAFVKGIPILPCVSVATNHGSVLIDHVLLAIAKRMAKSGDTQ